MIFIHYEILRNRWLIARPPEKVLCTERYSPSRFLRRLYLFFKPFHNHVAWRFSLSCRGVLGFPASAEHFVNIIENDEGVWVGLHHNLLKPACLALADHAV
jgi:hypothetical protein